MRRKANAGGEVGFHWLTVFAVIAAVLVNGLVAYGADEGRFSPAIARFANVFAYFTIQSNILTGIVAWMLSNGSYGDQPWFRVLRMTALIAITITGIVYHTLLRQEWDPKGWALVGDQLAHTVVPLLALVGFVLFGPRGLIDGRTVWLALIFPVLWSTFTVIRGEIVDWYPYPFIDVTELGYDRVFLNMAGIAAIFLLVGFAYRWADGKLSERRKTV